MIRRNEGVEGVSNPINQDLRDNLVDYVTKANWTKLARIRRKICLRDKSQDDIIENRIDATRRKVSWTKDTRDDSIVDQCLW